MNAKERVDALRKRLKRERAFSREPEIWQSFIDVLDALEELIEERTDRTEGRRP